MLTTARPIFEHVPASFADPVGLADQQAPGVVALIVVRYGPPEPNLTPTEGTAPFVLGTTYDAFVAVSGQLLAVARSTPDYRYPVTPAVALAHFLETRDAGRPAFLSLFELDESKRPIADQSVPASGLVATQSVPSAATSRSTMPLE